MKGDRRETDFSARILEAKQSSWLEQLNEEKEELKEAQRWAAETG